jgi:predicted negative regulator of RcsB-dependent stress response
MRQGPVYRVVGAPPTADATREEHLRWVRKFYRANLATVVVAVILALVGGGTFWWILAAIISAAGLASISFSIH